MVNMTLTFKTHDDYLKEGRDSAEGKRVFAERLSDAEAEYRELKTQYSLLIEESVRNGKENTKDIDELTGKVDQSKKTIDRRKAEYDVANTIRERKMKVTDVLNDYKGAYAKEVIEKEVKPIYDRLELAKALIMSAYKDYLDKKGDYNNLRTEMYELSKHAKNIGELDTYVAISCPFDEGNNSLGVKHIRTILQDLEASMHSLNEYRRYPENMDYIAEAPKVGDE
jgi:hypothetical protein